MKVKRRPGFALAMLPIAFLILSLSCGVLIYGADPQIPLLATTVVAAGIGKYLRYTWDEMEKGIVNTILPAMQAILIQMIIGVIIGTWILGGSILGAIFAVIYQGAGIGDIIGAAHYGYVSETSFEAVDKLLTRGGLDSMMFTVSLILVTMSFEGVVEKIGVLEVIGERLLKFAKSTGSLVATTAVTCIFCNFTMSDQYLAIVVPGRMFKKRYEEEGLHLKNLSRVLEDTGTITSALVPWSTCGAFMYATLAVHPFAYLPFEFLNLINPIVSVVYGYLGISMERTDKKKVEDAKLA